MNLPIPMCNGFEIIDNMLAWKNSKEKTAELVCNIKDKIIFNNCCNAAIVWWTERMVEFGKIISIKNDRNEEKEARNAVRIWREFKEKRNNLPFD